MNIAAQSSKCALDELECGNSHIVPILVAVVVEGVELVADVQLLDVPDEVVLPHLEVSHSKSH